VQSRKDGGGGNDDDDDDDDNVATMLVTASFSVFHPNSINTQFTYLSSQII
jgi:hypothetical protein